jgi:hypothetical protein
VAWRPPDKGLSPDHWVEAGRVFGRAYSGVRWWVGDWLTFGETAFGDRVKELTESGVGVSYEALANWAYVARNVDLSFRNENLTFTHHMAVAPLAPDLQRDWLDRAERESWTVAKLRAAIAASDRHAMPTHDAGPLAPTDSEAIPGECLPTEDEVDEADAAIDYPPDADVEGEAPRAVDPAVHAEKLKLTFKTFAGGLGFMKMADAKLFAGVGLQASKLRIASLLLQRVADLSERKATSAALFAYLIDGLLGLADEAPASLVGDLSGDELREAVALIGRVLAVEGHTIEHNDAA